MTTSNINSSRIKHTNATRYKIAQKVRGWRLKREYTLKDLADKTGIKYYTLLKYEQGVQGIPTEDLKRLADALSVNVGTLFPRRRILRKNFDKGKTQGTYNFTGKHTKTKVRELRKAIDTLTKFVRAEGKSNVKVVRIKMARNMVKAGFSVDIIYQATGLSADKYDNKWVKHQEEGREIKKWRIIRGYTQEDLAKKLGVDRSQIYDYERGNRTILSEMLWEIGRALSVYAEDLMHEPAEKDYYEDKGSKEENEPLTWARESKKIENQEPRDELEILVEFLSKRKQIYKKKIEKAEATKVANNLFILGISIDVIFQITGLSSEEIGSSLFSTSA